MKHIWILFSILMLTACAIAPTESASLFAPQPETVILKADSTSAEIQSAMLHSATMWKTLQLSGTITWYGKDGSKQVFQEQTWIDPLNNRYKIELNGVTNSSDKTVKFSDGKDNYNINMNSGLIEKSAYPDSARAGQYVPPLQDGVAYPNPMWGQMGTPLSELAFPSDYAQGKGTFKSLGTIEKIAGRDALIVEWTYAENNTPSWRAWLDVTTAVILKMQEFGVKDGSNALQDERVIDQIIYNVDFDPTLFVMPANVPQVTMPTQVGSIPVVTASAPAADKIGELYFFLQPRQSGGKIELARVSGVCIFDSANCPPLEKIAVPFPFNFTLNELTWSPDGKLAAFAYSDNANGTPQKLFLFDPAANTWTAIAQFPYIDPPFWSPDGNYIAFREQDGKGGEDVYVIGRDGKNLKSVAGELPASGKPYVMDGWYMDYIIMRPAVLAGKMSLVSASDGSVRPMFDTMPTKAQLLAAPDASLFAYDDYDASAQKHALKVIAPDGSNSVTLANFTGGSIYPIVWSPDSNLLAFNYYSDFASGTPAAEVYVVNRDGSKLSSVYKGATVGRLLFSPNGEYLLVEETTSPTGGHLFTINLATLEQKMLQAPGLSTDYDWYAPSWQP